MFQILEKKRWEIFSIVKQNFILPQVKGILENSDPPKIKNKLLWIAKITCCKSDQAWKYGKQYKVKKKKEHFYLDRIRSVSSGRAWVTSSQVHASHS